MDIEGDVPLVCDGPVNNIYAIEGQFMDELERGKSQLVARHPDEAHVFYLPISITRIVQYMYTPSVNYTANYLEKLATDYIHVIADKYQYWNKSSGAKQYIYIYIYIYISLLQKLKFMMPLTLTLLKKCHCLINIKFSMTLNLKGHCLEVFFLLP